MVEMAPMYSGTLIRDLIDAVERAEEASRTARMRRAESIRDSNELNSGAPQRKTSESEQLPQSLGLSAADRDLSLLFVVHPQLVRTLEPGNNFADAIDIYQVGSVSPPE